MAALQTLARFNSPNAICLLCLKSISKSAAVFRRGPGARGGESKGWMKRVQTPSLFARDAVSIPVFLMHCVHSSGSCHPQTISSRPDS